MDNSQLRSRLARRTVLSIVTAGVFGLCAPIAEAAISFLGVAAGDASPTKVTLWTRALDSAAPAATTLTLAMTTDPAFTSGITQLPGACTTDPSRDFICKIEVANLAPNTVYYYRFIAPANEMSNIGRVKTAPDPSTPAPLHFAFSGDNDGLIRPYALASVIPAQHLDFYVNLGDVIYETASNLTLTGAHNGAPWLNSPSVALSNDSLSFNGVPRPCAANAPPPCTAATAFATQAQLFADYSKKYRENLLPVNPSGQNSLQDLYAAQGNYTTWDNHELGNRKYIDGGAPAGGSVGGTSGADMPTGRGVDARDNGAGNLGNVNDLNNSLTDYMNRSTGFLTLRNVFLNYQPIANRPLVNAPNDPRTDGSAQIYLAQPWGRNAIYINTDSRSYRDLRLKTANAGADDSGARADNPARTYLGATQLAWLKQTLLDAQHAGTAWKFVTISDPIDQIGPIGGALTLTNPPPPAFPGYSPVTADSGKSYIGGYRSERNELLKFIADNHITNVVFMATDDHQNRINELSYSATGQTSVQSSYVKVPFAFSIVAGPLGATGPDLITTHSFSIAKQFADSIVAAQQAAGLEPFGLIGYRGLHDLTRDGDPTAGTNPQPADFYSPDTFNFTVLDVTADGKTLTLTSIGMDSTAVNVGKEYADGPQARTIFSFKVDAAPTIDEVQINDGSAQRSRVRSVTVTLNGIIAPADIAPGAFTVNRAEGVNFTATVQAIATRDRQTVITLAFAGPGVGPDGALPDGSYTLSVDRTRIPLDSPSPVTEIAAFQALFGDLDGDGMIVGSEVAASAHANGAKRGDADYLWYLDFDANGKIDGTDHREVARRNGDN